MWIDTAQCPETFHIIGKDADDRWAVIHSDQSTCELIEFGGEAVERIDAIESAEVETEMKGASR